MFLVLFRGLYIQFRIRMQRFLRPRRIIVIVHCSPRHFVLDFSGAAGRCLVIILRKNLVPQLSATVAMRRLPHGSRGKGGHVRLAVVLASLFRGILSIMVGFRILESHWLLCVNALDISLSSLIPGAIESRRQANVAKVTGRNIRPRSRRLEPRRPFWTAFISKSPGRNGLEAGNSLEALCHVSCVLVVAWAWEFGCFHDVGRYLYLPPKLSSPRPLIRGQGVAALLIKPADVFVAAGRRIVVLGRDVVVVEEVDLVAHGETDRRLSEGFLVDVV